MAKNITVSVLADTKKFSGAMKKLGNETGLSKLAAGAKKMGKAFAIASGVVIAGGVVLTKKLIDAGEAANTSNARVEQIATSMGLFGDQAGAVAGRLTDLANKTAVATGVDQNQIKMTQSKLLTFKELAKSADAVGGQFDRATKAAIDLGAAGFGTAEGNAVQLGKAMNDPIKGISALNRMGVQFTDTEKARIKTLVESNKVGEAQSLILDAIEKQVGGTAEATADATDRMKVRWSQLQETLGLKLMPILDRVTAFFLDKFVPAIENGVKVLGDKLQPVLQQATQWWQDNEAQIKTLAETIKTGLVDGFNQAVAIGQQAVDWLKDMVTWVKENHTWLGPLAVAVGAMVTAYMGVQKIIAIVTALKAVMAAAKLATIAFNTALLANPIGLIVAAVAALAAGLTYFFTQTELGQEIWAKVWGGIQAGFQAFMDWVQPTLDDLQSAWQVIWENIQLAWEAIGPPLMAAIGIAIDIVKNNIQTAMNIIRGIFETAWNQIKNIVETVMGVVQGVIKTVTSLIKGDWEGVWQGIKQIFGSILNGIWNTVKNIFNGIKNTIGSALNGMYSNIKSIINGVREFITNGLQRAKDGAVTAVTTMVTNVKTTGTNLITFFKSIPGKLVSALAGLASKLLSPFKSAFNGIARAWNNTVGKISFQAPDWVPGLGGKGFSVPKIPMLAKGGTALNSGWSLVGENGPEFLHLARGASVVPLNHPYSAKATGKVPGSGYEMTNLQTNINVTVQAGIGDPYAIAREIRTVLDRYTQTNGRNR